MTDIFLSYAREDIAKAQQLAAALKQQGWCVFWDRDSLLPGQDFDDMIEQAINQAKCMIVAWSSTSIRSDWVRGEATIGREGKILIPILFDAVNPPIAFRALHTENFAAWNGNINSEEFKKLQSAIVKFVEPTLKPQQILNTYDENTDGRTTRNPKGERINQNKNPAYRTSGITEPYEIMRTKKINPQKTLIASAILGSLIIIAALNFFTSKRSDTTDENIPAKTTQPITAVSPTPTKTTSIATKPAIKEPEMIPIGGGSFNMGSNNGEDDEKPVHNVTLKSFAIGRYEVTFDEYDQYAEMTGKDKPADKGWGRGKRPVINVSWEDATAYAIWLKEKTGKAYRLPTEAEWEYAARATKTTTDFYTGNCINTDQANYDGNYDYNNCGAKTGVYKKQTLPVGSYASNKWGLHDTDGNVLEWVQDCYVDNYKQAPTDGSALEAPNCDTRVLRGGSWSSIAQSLRSANRHRHAPVNRFNYVGFRLAQD